MIFGTDGLRAAVGQEPLTEGTILRLSQVLRNDVGSGAKIVIGRDTRRSGDSIFKWITRQLGGTKVFDLGIVPTPAVAYETFKRRAALGIMITASHNPPSDNGLKFFNSQGLKVTYSRAQAWSDEVLSLEITPPPDPVKAELSPVNAYRNFILSHFNAEAFRGLRVAFDFAHGAVTGLGQELLTGLIPGAIFLGNYPDGDNINQGVGALHPEALIEVVKSKNLDAGFAFDGDGDRLIAVDQQGVLHGDVLLYALKQLLVRQGQKVEAIVGTILCGLGFEQLLQKEGISLHRVAVGDQNVLAKMVSDAILLGGEPSGHLIQGDLFPAGDGLLAALRIAKGLTQDSHLLKNARAAVPQFPIFEEAYRVRHKPPLESLKDVQQRLRALEEALGTTGRSILRYSGTEPKIRLFVETPELDRHMSQVQQLVLCIKENLA